MKKEKWKRTIQDKQYLVSSWGRVYSLKSNKFIKSYIHKSRSGLYLRVCLSNNKKYMTHILVGENFLPFEDAKPQINHKDRNTLNPNLNNLERESDSGNKLHMHATSSFMWWGKLRK